MRYRLIICLCLAAACSQGDATHAPLAPRVVTERVPHDSDDPAIWIDPTDPARSLILGTDKNEDGGLYVFDLAGRMLTDKTVRGLRRPNNVDIEYGFSIAGKTVDIAVVTERYANRIRVFQVPEIREIDGGGIEVFSGESQRDPMGIAVYKRPSDGAIFAIVSRKSGPTDGRYLWQYRLEDDGGGKARGMKVREFGIWSGNLEIEAIAVDDPLGYVYYSDEATGIRKYYADPDHPNANKELALFGTSGFDGDREGICIYPARGSAGYIIVSDQAADRFHLYRREGEPDGPHDHRLVKIVRAQARQTDGCEVTGASLGDRFPYGLFVAMSDDGSFHYYSWKDIRP